MKSLEITWLTAWKMRSILENMMHGRMSSCVPRSKNVRLLLFYKITKSKHNHETHFITVTGCFGSGC